LAAPFGGSDVAAQMYFLSQGLVGPPRCLIIDGGVKRSQHLFAAFGGRMRHGKYLTIGAIVMVALAAQAIAAPKRTAPKKPPPIPETTDPAQLPPITTFIIYDVGTLWMTGKKAADMIYRVGTLRMDGRGGASTIYSVGTLSMTGKFEH
jgi:hypothetical protein